MAHFIVALLQLWPFFLPSHHPFNGIIVVFSSIACEVIQNSEVATDCSWFCRWMWRCGQY